MRPRSPRRMLIDGRRAGSETSPANVSNWPERPRRRRRTVVGKVPPLEESRARAELAAARIGLNGSRELPTRRAAASWRNGPVFESAKGSLEGITPVGAADAEKVLASGPDMARRAVILERHAAAVEVEKSRRIPDVTVTGGGMRFTDSDENAVVAGVSAPLPLFDLNRGNVDMERAHLAKAEEGRRTGQLRARSSDGVNFKVGPRAGGPAMMDAGCEKRQCRR